jgi:DNA polymerase-1
MPKRLVIIDGYSLLYRAFFATRFLSTADGRPTNALFGFVSMLFHLLENVRPDAVVVAMDAPGKTFRHADYAEYKGTRRDTPDELIAQFPVARDLIEALGISSIEATGFEADDVVGTLSLQAEKNGYSSIIVTGDLDALQLVDESVSVLTMRQGVTDTVTYDPQAVRDRYGFDPVLIPDYKAIVGDTSDNIPGVPGIGAKGATDLLQKFPGGVEAILERFAEVDPKYQKKIAGNEEQMRKSKWLATIVRDAPVRYDFRPFSLTPPQLERAKEVLDSLEFRSHVRRANLVLGRYFEGAVDEPVIEVQAEVIEARTQAASNLAELQTFVGSRPYALFLATPQAASDLFEQIETRAYIAVGADVREADEETGLRLLATAPAQAILHDAKPLYRHHPELIDKPGYDTMLAAYVLQSGRSGYALRDLVQGYLEAAPPSTPAAMAVALYRLQGALADRLEKEGQTRVLLDVELPLVPILADMERLGIRAERDTLREFSKTLEITIEQSTRRIYELAGHEFNIGSPKQLGEVLFEKMGIPGGQKTKTGWATGAEVLSLIAPTYEVAAEILNWRELSKLKSTYTDALERLIGPDGRIHTTYQQAVAATGRLSSIDPNLQNIPIRTELGRGIRKAFVAAPGYRLASLDYSQIELRVLAHMCGDEALVRAFSDREDVHTVTAQRMFGISADLVSKEMRRLAKMLNYAVLYGVTDFGLAQQLGGGFSIAEAKALINQYFERFPKVKDFTSSIVAEARSKGFTATLFGRRRYFPDIHAVKVNERRYAERQAMNAPIQGTAADMLKLAMIRTYRHMNGASARMLLNVHDELVFEIDPSSEPLINTLRTEMEDALPLSVPVEVDAKIGADWNDMTEVAR